MTGDERAWVPVLVAHDLGQEPPRSAVPLDAARWSRLLAFAALQRLQPQLARAVWSGALPATADQRAEAAGAHRRAMATVLLLDRALLDVADRFERARVRFVVLKGAAVAHLDHADPAARAYGDVDVLVPPDRIDRAAACLAATGARRAYREPRPGFDRRFGKGMSFRSPAGLEVDVHRTLVLGPFGLAIDLDELWAGTEPFTCGGRTLMALDRPRRFLHACLHGALGRASPRVVPLLDVARTAPRNAEEWSSVAELAARWRAEAVVASAIDAARDTLAWDPPTAVVDGARRLRPGRTEQRWLATYRGGGRSSARLSLAAVGAIDGWRDRLDYLVALVWPTGSTLRSAVTRAGRRLGARSGGRRTGVAGRT